MSKFKSAAILCAVLLPIATAHAQTRHEYWYTSATDNNERVEYVDAASITSDKTDIRRAWIMAYYNPHAPKFAGMHTAILLEVNCRTKQLHVLQLSATDSNGSIAPAYSDNKPDDWSYAVPDSVGETKLNFICAKTEAERHSIGVKLPPSVAPAENAKSIFDYPHPTDQTPTAQ